MSRYPNLEYVGYLKQIYDHTISYFIIFLVVYFKSWDRSGSWSNDQIKESKIRIQITSALKNKTVIG